MATARLVTHAAEDQTPSGLLSTFLRHDDAAREATVARFVMWIALCGAGLTAALTPLLGREQVVFEAGGLAAIALYYVVVSFALRRGWYSPAIRWVNVAVEGSAPLLLYILDLHFHGPEFALSTPPVMLWSCSVLLSALRTSRRLTVAAGLFAAAEYLVLYFGWTLPALPVPIPLPLTPGFILVRAFILAACGALASLVVDHTLRQAEATFRAIREQDLMGKYLLGERIGSGGMADVFRATYMPEGGFEKPVAIKRIHGHLALEPNFLKLFRREAQIGSLLAHPNIVQILDLGRHQGSYFLAMEYVDGMSLSAAQKALRRPLPLAALTFVGAEIADALDYIHRRASPEGEPLKLVHRDVNPPNILLSRYGDVKLADFGIARAAKDPNLTNAGDVRGKIGFLAPEQIEHGEFDSRTDLFALGLTLYVALTGQSATPGKTRGERVHALLQGDFQPPSVLRPEVPVALDEIVLSLLQYDRKQRLPSGRILRDQLCRLEGDAAPYPAGKTLLAAYVQQAAQAPARAEAPEPEGQAPTQVESRPTQANRTRPEKVHGPR